MLLHLVNKRGVEMNKSKTRLAVGAVIMQSNEVLLVHKVKVMTEGQENDKGKGTWDFPKGYKYASQKTIMYHVIYTGDRSDIKAKDEEIDNIKFVKYIDVLNNLELEETKSFFIKCIGFN